MHAHWIWFALAALVALFVVAVVAAAIVELMTAVEEGPPDA